MHANRAVVCREYGAMFHRVKRAAMLELDQARREFEAAIGSMQAKLDAQAEALRVHTCDHTFCCLDC